jgi:hypothetical protein
MLAREGPCMAAAHMAAADVAHWKVQGCTVLQKRCCVLCLPRFRFDERPVFVCCYSCEPVIPHPARIGWIPFEACPSRTYSHVRHIHQEVYLGAAVRSCTVLGAERCLWVPTNVALPLG